MKRHLRVSKLSGQAAIKELRRIDAIDDQYNIIKENSYLLLPLRDNFKEINERLGEVVSIKGEKSNRKPPPQGIRGSYDIIGSIVLIKRTPSRSIRILAENLLKRPGIRSVYMDSGVSGQYRQRDLSLVSGEDNKITEYKENGITLKVDVENAYFSPRLATERRLVSDKVSDGNFVIDMFSGIGPFSILIARNHKCKIVAIDHNPHAIELLKENVLLNKLKGEVIPILGKSETETARYHDADRIIMNLPHGAAPFLEVAINALKPGGIVNFYEVTTVEGITDRMIMLKDKGLSLISKREVHGYSKGEYMYSLELRKEN